MTKRRRSKREGMTLIEIMVVVVIMSLFAVATTINVLKWLESARRDNTLTRARTIQTAAVQYLMDDGGDCPSVQELAPRLDSTTEHTDGWGHAFELSCEDDAVHVRSPGPDGDFGNDDDVGF